MSNNAKERGTAILAMRGKGATQESIRQMSMTYADDASIMPHDYVTDKFEAAKAITAFGGRIVFQYNLTPEAVFTQREQIANHYLDLDFSLDAGSFIDALNAFEAQDTIKTNTENARKVALGLTTNKTSVSILDAVSKITVADISRASLVTRDNLEQAIARMQYLLAYKSPVVVVSPVAGELVSA
jgi:hypothetical protein